MKHSIPLLFILIFLSCKNEEITHSKKINPDAIYFDYRIFGEEGKAITCLIRYRAGGPNGTTLILEPPSKVEIDGTELPLDSAGLTGAFYELSKPVEDFRGRHTIVFTGSDNKKYKEDFAFIPFSFAETFPKKIKREKLAITLNDFEKGSIPVRLVMTDTAFNSMDVNEIRNVVDGKLIIDESLLKNLKNGPVMMEIYREEEKAVKKGTQEGGKLMMTYGIKRDLELVSK